MAFCTTVAAHFALLPCRVPNADTDAATEPGSSGVSSCLAFLLAKARAVGPLPLSRHNLEYLHLLIVK